MPFGPSAVARPALSYLNWRRLSVAAVIGCLLVLVCAVNASAATTRFAAPGGTGANPCANPAEPCSLFVATDPEAPGTTIAAGDEVILAPGTYFEPKEFNKFGGLQIPPGVSFHGTDGLPRPVIAVLSSSVSNVLDIRKNAVVSDVEVVADAAQTAVSVQDGILQNSVVRKTGSTVRQSACSLSGESLVRNTVCLLNGEKGFAVDGISLKGTSLSRLRNVTAVATGPGTIGMHILAEGNQFNPRPIFTVKAGSVIVSGQLKDVVAEGTGSSFPKKFPEVGGSASVEFNNSDYRTISLVNDPESNGSANITAPGTGTNIQGGPLLVGDGYHQQPNSPTVNAGAVDEFSATIDIDGQSRTLGPASDIGADEFAPGSTSSVSCEPSSVPTGETSTCTMTVSDNNPSPTPPNGFVEFRSNGQGTFAAGAICVLVAANASQSTCQLGYTPSLVGTGVHQITATYRGADHNSSSATTAVNVSQARTATTTSVFCSPGLVKVGQGATCFASVAAPSPAPEELSGEVKFQSDGEGEFSSAACTLEREGTEESSCEVTYTPTAAGTGAHRVSAAYQGDAAHGLSEGAFTISIKTTGEEEEEARAPTTTKLTCQDSLAVGREALCIALVTDTSATPSTPTGGITFESSNAGEFSTSGSCNLTSRGPDRAGCQVNYTPSATGDHKITASYGGDGTHRTSQGFDLVKVGTVRFAAPGATGSDPCADPAAPCSLFTAADETAPGTSVKAGDEVILAPGTYTGAAGDFGPGQIIRLRPGTSFHGAEGQPRPLLEPPSSSFLFIEEGTTVSHIEVNGSAIGVALNVSGGTVEDTIARSSVANATTCAHSSGIIRDSACLSSGAGANAIAINIGGSAPGSTTLRNVTAISTGAGSFGLNYKARGREGVHASLKVDAMSVIARGGAADVAASGLSETPETPGSGGVVEIDLDHSDYATTQTNTGPGDGSATVTPSGSGSNIVAAPLLEADNIHQIVGSPTIDAGATDQLSGARDIDGTLRTAGANADIGADEFSLNATATNLSCQPNPVALEEASTCLATVVDSSEKASVPTGKVEFVSNEEGEFSNSTCELTAQGADRASCEVTYTPTAVGVGIHQIVAGYEGDESHEQSQGIDQLGVTRNPTSTTLDCQPFGPGSTTESTCTVTVTDTGENDRTAPQGVIGFTTDSEGIFFSVPQCFLAPAGADSASCEVTYVALAPGSGTHTITASFPGDPGHESSTGTDTVEVAPENPARNKTATGLSCNPTELVLGERTICLATVIDLGANPTAPSGGVQFATSETGVFTHNAECTLVPLGSDRAGCKIGYTPSSDGVGSNRIFATYRGDAAHRRSQGFADIELLHESGHPTKTELSCDPGQAEIGQASTCTATVVDTDPTETAGFDGQVTFQSDSFGDFSGNGVCALQSVGQQTSCQVTYTPTLAGSGEHEIVATYEGDGVHRHSQGITTVSIVADERNPTATTVVCDPHAVSVPDPSTCTATVEDTSATSSTPSGRVDFTVVIAPDTSSGQFIPNFCDLTPASEGKASCQVEYFPDGPINAGAGVHSLTGSYGGDVTHRRSAGTDEIVVSNETVTTLACDPGSVKVLEASTCTATVQDITDEATIPAGKVHFDSDQPGLFSDGSTCTLGAPAEGGKVSCQVTYTPSDVGSGSHGITATYEGEFEHRSSNGGAQIAVSQNEAEEEEEAERHPTTTAIDCQPELVPLGKSTACSVVVTDIAATPTAPNGQIELSSNGEGVFSATSCDLVAAGADSASCELTYTPTSVGSGGHIVTARYGGDATHRRSEGTDPISVTNTTEEEEEEGGEAGKHPTATTLSCLPGQVAVINASTCTATVTDTATDGATAPSGRIELSSDGEGVFANAGACTLSDSGQGVASCELTYTPTAVGSGSHLITADYRGDPTHRISQDTDLINVTETTEGEEEEGGEAAKHPTATALTCQPGEVEAGTGSTTCTAVVTDTAAEPTNPSGTVAFSSSRAGSFGAASCDLASEGADKASCQVTYDPTAAGIHKITADYSNDQTHRISQRSFDLSVTGKGGEEEEGGNAHVTATTLQCLPASLNLNANANCTVTVKDTSAQSATAPSGKVSFSSDATGTFAGDATCTLADPSADSASCSLAYTAEVRGTHNLKAAFEGNAAHKASEDSDSVTVKTAAEEEEAEEEEGEEEEEGGNAHDTATTLSCLPGSLNLNGTANCLATVKDTTAAGATAPSGEVKFSSDAEGTFTGEAACTLISTGPDSAACAVEYTANSRGPHAINAAFGGNAAHKASEDSDSVTVRTAAEEEEAEEEGEEEEGGNAHATSTTLSCLPASLNLNGSANCLATVKDTTTASATSPSGQVKFSSDATGTFAGDATCTLVSTGPDSAACVLAYAAEARGDHNLKAAFQGTAAHEASNGSDTVNVKSAEEEEAEEEEGNAHATSTALSCLPASLNLNGNANCTVTVKDTAAQSATAPSGKVSFSSDATGTFAGDATCTLADPSADSASCSLAYTAEVRGTHNLKAAFEGNAAHKASEGADSITVRSEVEEEEAEEEGEEEEGGAHDTVTTFNCSPSSLNLNGASSCKARVIDLAPQDAVTPAGVVNFTSNSQGTFSSGATCELEAENLLEEPTKSASCTVIYTAEARGLHNLKAAYQGNAAHKASEDTDTVTVKSATEEEEGGEGENTHATSTALSCLPASLNLNGTANCLATVKDTSAAGATAPSGEVKFSSDAEGAFTGEANCTLISTGADSAACAVEYTANARGPHNLKAAFQGTPAHEASNGSDTVTVKSATEEEGEEEEGENAHATSTALSCLPASLNLNGVANCLATVKDTTTTATVPSGEVKFSSDAAGTFTGQAACTLISTGPDSAACAVEYTANVRGDHNLKAAFQGNAAHEASNGSDTITVRSVTEEEEAEEEGEEEGNVHATSTALSCLPASLNLDGVANCLATVKDTTTTATVPSGEVKFSSDAAGTFTGQAACTLISTGPDSAACAVEYTANVRGDHNLKAAFQGTTAHEASNGSDTITVKSVIEEEEEHEEEEGNAHATSTVLSCLPASLNLNGVANCLATVKDTTATGATVPSGEVKFSSDAEGTFTGEAKCTLISTGPDSAACAVEYTANVRGPHNLKAAFQDSSAHEASEDTDTVTVRSAAEEEEAEEEEEGEEEGNAHATSTALSCLPASLNLNGVANCLATVKDTTGASATAPSGQIKFSTDATGAFAGDATCTLISTGADSAACALPYTANVRGPHNLKAAFQGTTAHEASEDTDTVTVKSAAEEEAEEEEGEEGNAHATSTTLSCLPASLNLSGVSNCLATVKDTTPAAATSPSGQVKFSTDANGTFAGDASCTLTSTGPDSAACALPYTANARGPHNLKAAFQGTTAHEASNGSDTVTVKSAAEEEAEEEEGGNAHATATTQSCLPASLNLNGVAICLATVKDTTATAVTPPSGQVKFSSDATGTFAGNATCTLIPTGVDSAACALPYTAEARGDHNLKAAFQGTTAHEASNGSDTVAVKSAAEEEAEEEEEEGGNAHATTTALSCLPASLNLNGFTNCVATVKDTTAAAATSPSGQVKFSSDATGTFAGNASCTLVSTGPDSAACALPYTAEARGDHNLKASFQGNAAHEASDGSDTVTVKSAEEEGGEEGEAHVTATTLNCLPASLDLNAAANCTVTVSDTDQTPTAPSGKVSFSTDANGTFAGDATCTLTDPSADSASCSLAYTAEARGVHNIKAAFEGNAAHKASEDSDSVTVKSAEEEAEGKNPTTTALNCQPASVILGGGSVCTVAVTDTAAATAPSGDVEFQSSRPGTFSEAGICSLAPAGANRARCQVVFTAGELDVSEVTASYGGDNSHEASSGKANVTATPKNGGHAATTNLSCNPDEVILGGASVCTVEVVDIAANRVSPSGLVVFASNEAGEFGSGGCTLFPVATGLSRCQIIYTPSAIGSGAHKITAVYSGDAAHEPSLSERNITVRAKNSGHPTATALNCGAGTTVGLGTKCTVTVTNTDGSPVLPGKSVIFGSDSAGTFTPGGCNLAGANGKSTCEVTYTPSQVDSGTHKITAVYEGDNSHEPSQGLAELTVKAVEAPPVIDPTATTIACAPTSALLAAATTCTATVADTAAPPSNPSGAVKFATDSQGNFSNGATCALAPAGTGKASCQVTYTPTTLGSGTHKISASYEGDATHKPSAGETTVTVVAPPETFIKKHPRKKTALKVGRFTFGSDQSPVTFECKLDRMAFRPCKAAFNTRTLKKKRIGKRGHKKLRFVFKLRNGAHVLQVRAKNAQGAIDPTPAVYRWRVGPVRHAKPKKH
jgi:hypothetical protein